VPTQNARKGEFRSSITRQPGQFKQIRTVQKFRIQRARRAEFALSKCDHGSENRGCLSGAALDSDSKCDIENRPRPFDQSCRRGLEPEKQRFRAGTWLLTRTPVNVVVPDIVDLGTVRLRRRIDRLASLLRLEAWRSTGARHAIAFGILHRATRDTALPEKVPVPGGF
jgi:hypothetical protein